MRIDKTLKGEKKQLLSYFRDRASESITFIKQKYAESQSDKRARAINESLNESKSKLINTVIQQAEKEKWTHKEKLECLLMITYCHNVIMIESRNSVRLYEYMDFSRRVGELWDPFCKLCFYYPINDVELFVPPLFSEVKEKLTHEIIDYINRLKITSKEKQDLIKYYDKVWKLVTSGEIQLELDLHFKHKGQKYVVDFKSGFGSNEKGNTNRLLLVASIYKSLSERYKCLLFVRNDENNSYFNTLKNSGIWDAYCGGDAYKKINEFSGYNLKKWIDTNVDWTNDFKPETTTHFEEQKLLQYLLW
ncbi:MAG: hypothetical protein AB2L26_06580 [Ignavibacteria bacterium]